LEGLKAYVQTRGDNDPPLPSAYITVSRGEYVYNSLGQWVYIQKRRYTPIFERIQLKQKVDPTSQKRVKLLMGIVGWTWVNRGRRGVDISVIEYSLHDGKKIRTYDNSAHILSTTKPGKTIHPSTVGKLINGTLNHRGQYTVQVEGRVFRKASNVLPLTTEQKMIDQLIMTAYDKQRVIYLYCVIEDVEDDDPNKYEWWKISEFVKKFDLTRHYLGGQLKKNGCIFIDGILYKKSPMYYIPKY